MWRERFTKCRWILVILPMFKSTVSGQPTFNTWVSSPLPPNWTVTNMYREEVMVGERAIPWFLIFNKIITRKNKGRTVSLCSIVEISTLGGASTPFTGWASFLINLIGYMYTCMLACNNVWGIILQSNVRQKLSVTSNACLSYSYPSRHCSKLVTRSEFQRSTVKTLILSIRSFEYNVAVPRHNAAED